MLSSIIIGCAWGIFEATVGYLLHLFAFGIGAYVWFPAAFFFLYLSYNFTRKYKFVMLSAFIAAAFKFLNLLLSARVDTITNPAVSIILEATAFISISKLISYKKYTALPFLVTNIVWRAFYLLIFPAKDTAALFHFLITENLVTSVIIYLDYLAIIWLCRLFGNNTYTRLTKANCQIQPSSTASLSAAE